MRLIILCLIISISSFSQAAEQDALSADMSASQMTESTYLGTLKEGLGSVARKVGRRVMTALQARDAGRKVHDTADEKDLSVEDDFILISNEGKAEVKRLRKELGIFNQEVQGLTDNLSKVTIDSQRTAQDLTETISLLQQDNQRKEDTIKRLSEQVTALKKKINPSYTWTDDLLEMGQVSIEPKNRESLKAVLERYEKLMKIKNTFEEQLQEMAAQQNGLLDKIKQFQSRLNQLSSENSSLKAENDEVKTYADVSFTDFKKMLQDKEDIIRALGNTIGELELRQENLEVIIRAMFIAREEEELEGILTALGFSALQKDVVRNICKIQGNNE